ncbi:MAG: bifunctional N-acetylglucosamine-1-phosphate uridyltransferase/glucosamine-1-phosphate acetyltransferase [Candidatus Omnitrophota bacterium]
MSRFESLPASHTFMKNITAVILAAGLGTRMKTEIPKVLHRVGSKTILDRIVSNFKKAGIKKIIAVVGYKAELVEKAFEDEVDFVRQPELLGSGNALACAVEHIKDPDPEILVTCGDTPLITAETYERLIKAYLQEKVSCGFLTCRVQEPLSYGRIVRDKSGEIERIVEEKDASNEEKKINEINVGTYCFRGSELREFINAIEINKKKKEFYLTDIVEILARNGKKVLTQECGAEEAIGINSRKDLAEVNKMVNQKTIEKLMESGVTVIDPDNAYIDETAEIGKDTIIFPGTVIERDVKIADNCKIGPFARLRPGTRISRGAEVGNFVELCRAEIGEGAKVKHHTYLGDTVVGKDANIGAGTITANYDGKNKYPTVIGEGAFIGVGAILIAPVKIGKNAQVGAGSVVTKNKDVKDGQTVVGVPARPFTAGKGVKNG